MKLTYHQICTFFLFLLIYLFIYFSCGILVEEKMEKETSVAFLMLLNIIIFLYQILHLVKLNQIIIEVWRVAAPLKLKVSSLLLLPNKGLTHLINLSYNFIYLFKYNNTGWRIQIQSPTLRKVVSVVYLFFLIQKWFLKHLESYSNHTYYQHH